MTTEEKAKAYDEAYKKVAIRFGSNVADEIFLKEGEDERIRKAIKKALQVRCDGSRIISDEPVTLEEAISWLEKQGEQKSYGQRQECVNCQFNYAGECKGSCAMKRDEQKPAFEMKTPEESLGISSEEYNKIVDECVYGDDKPTWSEEDGEMRMKVLKYLSTRCNVFEYEEVECWLNSLKDRYTWKPSNEQIVTFWDAICNLNHDGYKWIDDLKSLFQDLKKLRGE